MLMHTPHHTILAACPRPAVQGGHWCCRGSALLPERHQGATWQGQGCRWQGGAYQGGYWSKCSWQPCESVGCGRSQWQQHGGSPRRGDCCRAATAGAAAALSAFTQPLQLQWMCRRAIRINSSSSSSRRRRKCSILRSDLPPRSWAVVPLCAHKFRAQLLQRAVKPWAYRVFELYLTGIRLHALRCSCEHDSVI